MFGSYCFKSRGR
ncbi:hypothetical protein CGLO_04746 [Colletotrichum gloeosporioides Cg-14]|uniref:Uncharacterized protein n=1 Tax=Colletotrichum gloeosporioides (strain Cg-14) TaxID=1237896 RepID=T0KT99_COLGC|nr:hypothetical protein CGLO_04746 [Colletotrichum gloeosporioides Cg-14]